ncbi:hypothetical protein YK48G_14590 [Lentilactobacillus fungorum]|uniref:Uncharacterized protein n=1 Tax=Lentilactobacillus fungorum TaxID=2201250 RepID=A0ABQ3W340_9LACO|nr:hypothetical protein [Lentilactobacillus fungorum]GHP14034.1 hypothetical protein YK48G_14590 [Lentilactobacillus fungorum]
MRISTEQQVVDNDNSIQKGYERIAFLTSIWHDDGEQTTAVFSKITSRPGSPRLPTGNGVINLTLIAKTFIDGE